MVLEVFCFLITLVQPDTEVLQSGTIQTLNVSGNRMNPILLLLTFVFLTAFSSCGENGLSGFSVNRTKEGISSTSTDKTSGKARQERIAEDNLADSVRLNKLLQQALLIAKENVQSNHFTKEYEITPDDSSQNFTIDIIMGHLFLVSERHLLIRRINSSAAYLDLYLIKSNKFKLVISREQDGMSYVGDTIRDVNGDGLKDFLVHWYPSSGCCRRNVYNVYLYQAEKGTFTNDYEFINPTFSPKERIIRGVNYGHPGEVPMYKYRWNGFQVDTIEYIYPDPSDTINRRYFKTKKEMYSSESVTKTPLKAIPKEYYKIESYDCFNDY